MAKVKICETILRDAHQSLIATRMTTDQMIPILNKLDDIGYTEKSETRILIEKFVDENPDAVALLLRNWLNEEWD